MPKIGPVTLHEANEMRSAVEAALNKCFDEPVVFVIVAQRQDLTLDIFTNAKEIAGVPELLKVAAEWTKTPVTDYFPRRHDA